MNPVGNKAFDQIVPDSQDPGPVPSGTDTYRDHEATDTVHGFGFVDDVDPAEREMRDREYDALVEAGVIEVGTGSIADLLASTDPGTVDPEAGGPGRWCRWCGTDCDCD